MSITLTERLQCDLECLLVGAFAPLKGFLGKEDYESVVRDMRLASGEVWPMPIVLPISPEEAEKLQNQEKPELELLDQYNNPLAVLEVECVYKPDLEAECEGVLGTTDRNHPYVDHILSNPDVYYVGGTVRKVNGITHYDFADLRMTPAQTKKYFADHDWNSVVAFQSRNPMHVSHYELTLNSLKEAGNNAKLLLHPVVGITQDEDVPYSIRVRAYKKMLARYPEDTVCLSLLPLCMRMAGPREALWHALIRRNYGATHFIVGRSHAGPSSKKADGTSFYGPYDAHDLLSKFEDEIGIKMIKSEFVVYEPTTNKHYKLSELPPGTKGENISGTQLREALRNGDPIPEWFSYPEVVEELRKSYKPLKQKGFCIFFSGLSGGGKSTLANYLKIKLEERDIGRAVSLLDGDIIRQNLSAGLGFSKADRSTNIRRVGFVAGEIVKHGGCVICSCIAPLEADRAFNRQLIEQYGGFFLVHINTSLEVCEKRDVKGLYSKARAGVIKSFTGIDSPYEIPDNAELVLECSNIEDIPLQLDKLVDMISAYI